MGKCLNSKGCRTLRLGARPPSLGLSPVPSVTMRHRSTSSRGRRLSGDKFDEDNVSSTPASCAKCLTFLSRGRCSLKGRQKPLPGSSAIISRKS